MSYAPKPMKRCGGDRHYLRFWRCEPADLPWASRRIWILAQPASAQAIGLHSCLDCCQETDVTASSGVRASQGQGLSAAQIASAEHTARRQLVSVA